jgi:hypothetical protein
LFLKAQSVCGRGSAMKPAERASPIVGCLTPSAFDVSARYMAPRSAEAPRRSLHYIQGLLAKLHYTNKLSNLLCNITNEHVGLWQDQRPTSVQLVGRWSCQSPASWPTDWLSGVHQPTSCTRRELVGQQVANLFLQWRLAMHIAAAIAPRTEKFFGVGRSALCAVRIR